MQNARNARTLFEQEETEVFSLRALLVAVKDMALSSTRRADASCFIDEHG
jgi:hypothetical protein